MSGGMVSAAARRLEAKLASLAAGGGLDAVGLRLTGAGMVSTMAAPYLNLKVQGARRSFGCAANGIADDYVKLNDALQTPDKIIELEAGTYLFNTQLTAPLCAGIVGEGDQVSTLKPGAAVAVAMSLGTTGPTNLRDFGINGALTANATGILFGNGTAMACNARRVYVQQFTGATGKAYHFGDVVKSQFTKLTAYQCGTGFYFEDFGGFGGFPTTLRLTSCVASSMTVRGLHIVTANQFQFINFVAESCAQEGALIAPVSADACEVLFDGAWFEANNGSNPANYHMNVNSGARTARVHVRDTYFDTTPASSKAIHFIGNGVRSILSAPMFGADTPGAVLVDAGSYVEVAAWNPNFSHSCITDTAGTGVIWPGKVTDNLQAAWTAYTPTYTTSVGDAAASFTGPGTVTTALARYKLIGKTLHLQIQASATLNAVTPSFIGVTLPAGLVAQNSAAFTPAMLANGATEMGYVRTVGSNVLRFHRTSGGNFSSGANVSVWACLEVELA